MITGSEPTVGARLQALLAAIKRSPIVVLLTERLLTERLLTERLLTERLLLARSWASVRKSPDVDAYVLAWIASHTRGRRRPPRMFM